MGELAKGEAAVVALARRQTICHEQTVVFLAQPTRISLATNEKDSTKRALGKSTPDFLQQWIIAALRIYPEAFEGRRQV